MSTHKGFLSVKRHSFGAYQSNKLNNIHKVDLKNFNPLNPERKLSSPKSIEVCKASGVSPDQIFYSTYAKIKQSANCLRRQSADYLKMKYIKAESSRQRLVVKLKEMRKALIEQESGHRELITRSFSIASSHGRRVLSLVRKNCILDKLLIIREKQYFKRRANKEISILIRKNLPLTRSIKERKIRSIGNLHYRKIRVRISKQRLLREDLIKERKDMMERLKDYKKELLEQKIQSCTFRASMVKKKKEELLRLRQQMRKNTLIQKYEIKAELEKNLKVLLYNNAHSQKVYATVHIQLIPFLHTTTSKR